MKSQTQKDLLRLTWKKGCGSKQIWTNWSPFKRGSAKKPVLAVFRFSRQVCRSFMILKTRWLALWPNLCVFIYSRERNISTQDTAELLNYLTTFKPFKGLFGLWILIELRHLTSQSNLLALHLRDFFLWMTFRLQRKFTSNCFPSKTCNGDRHKKRIEGSPPNNLSRNLFPIPIASRCPPIQQLAVRSALYCQSNP